jgi:hypothetical protein
LKALAKLRELKITGKKADLIARLLESDAAPPDFCEMDKNELLDVCNVR